MSWICDTCSTANEDHDRECFVCGEARSAESIREAERAEREARAERRSSTIYKCATVTGKVLFFSSIALFSVVALILLFLKMRNGAISDIVFVLFTIVENVVDQFMSLFGVNIVFLFTQLGDSPIKHLGRNFVEVFSQMGSTLYEGFRCVVTEMFVNRSDKFENPEQVAVAVRDQIVGALISRGTIVSHLLSQVWGQIVSTVNNGIAIFQNAKEAVLQFKR